MADGYSERSAGPGPGEGGRQPATSRSARPKLGSAIVLDEARRGTLPGLVKTDVTFRDTAEEWLRYVEHARGRKPSTIVGYRAMLRSQLLPHFGELPIESITTPMVEEWIAGVDRLPATRTKALVLMHGIFAGDEAPRPDRQPGC
jgi:hypothetical protein